MGAARRGGKRVGAEGREALRLGKSWKGLLGATGLRGVREGGLRTSGPWVTLSWWLGVNGRLGLCSGLGRWKGRLGREEKGLRYLWRVNVVVKDLLEVEKRCLGRGDELVEVGGGCEVGGWFGKVKGWPWELKGQLRWM